MKLIKSKSVQVVISILVLSMITLTAQAKEGRSGERKGPPPEAITACEGLEVSQACSFTGRHDKEVSGVCIVPRNDDSLLACKPERGEKQR